MKLAHTIRFDSSDLKVFPRAAEEGELAIVGTCCFSGFQEDELTGKIRQAFRNGFLGINSFGFSTFVCVSALKANDLPLIQKTLAKEFIREFNPEYKEEAIIVANQEIEFMASLCADHEVGTVIAIQREWTENGIAEAFRSISKADSCAEQKIWTIIDGDDLDI